MSSRNNNFKKGIDVSSCRSRREEAAIKLRKEKKTDSMAKRRNINNQDVMINNFTSENSNKDTIGVDNVQQQSTKSTWTVDDIPQLLQKLTNNNKEQQQQQKVETD